MHLHFHLFSNYECNRDAPKGNNFSKSMFLYAQLLAKLSSCPEIHGATESDQRKNWVSQSCLRRAWLSGRRLVFKMLVCAFGFMDIQASSDTIPSTTPSLAGLESDNSSVNSSVTALEQPLSLDSRSGGVRVRFCVRFHAVKVLIFGGLPAENPTNKATASKLFQGECLCPSTVRRGSEYGWGGCESTVLLLASLKDHHSGRA